MSLRFIGTVHWFDNFKGFGFLRREDGPDVFVHYKSIETEGYKSLQSGQLVSFEIVKGPHGPQADRVVPLGREPELTNA